MYMKLEFLSVSFFLSFCSTIFSGMTGKIKLIKNVDDTVVVVVVGWVAAPGC